MDALDARHHLLVLEEERSLAREQGLLDDPAYRADLEQEIDACRELYVGAAVTEIATLHGLLFGRHQG
ncbi:MAG TPA: hypothetical protein VD931_15640 [Baekduia sp.]|nr:hypothetical protein [Baekduia sp.]